MIFDNMKKLAIFCVTYNSYKELDNYIQSIEDAAKYVKGEMIVEVFIADNTEKGCKEEIEYVCHNISVKSFLYHKNLGYFGAIQQMMSEFDLTQYDYIAISNVDLVLEKNTLKSLNDIVSDESIGWIAPAIYSEKEKRDKNPRMRKRYSLLELQILRILYTYPFLHRIYTMTLYKRKKNQNHKEECYIYGGHGSFIILTNSFFRKCHKINYPMFLFGEEIYLSELCKNNGLKVKYIPSVRIKDKENVSTSKMKGKIFYTCNNEALRFIIDNFYKQ